MVDRRVFKRGHRALLAGAAVYTSVRFTPLLHIYCVHKWLYIDLSTWIGETSPTGYTLSYISLNKQEYNCFSFLWYKILLAYHI